MGKFHSGDIVYWCEHHGGADYRVNFGMVDEEFYDRVVVDCLELPERRKINGVPFGEFKDERWHKLPRGWTYNTRLFEETLDPLPKGLENLKFNNPQQIKKAVENGWLVKAKTIDAGYFEADITRDGYRIVYRTGSRYGRHRETVALYKDKAYFTYEEAQAEKDAYLAEFERQAALTDAEWSIEQIEKDLLRFRLSNGIPDDVIEECRKYLLSLPNIEEVVTRVSTKGLEWKYDRGKRWYGVSV